MSNPIKQAAQLIRKAKEVTALTGAGISVESGIPPFRGKGGLWEKFDPMEFAHIDNFMRNPEKVWEGFLVDMKKTLDTALPNDAHKGLAELEKMKKLKTIITQNIDGLHQLAGNADVIEFHGSFARYLCLDCDKMISVSDLKIETIPPLCKCGGILKPDCVFFGEQIPLYALTRSEEIIVSSDLMIIIGTSAVVQPFASIPFAAKENGAKIIEINPEPTQLTNRITDVFISEKAGAAMNQLIEAIKTFE